VSFVKIGAAIKPYFTLCNKGDEGVSLMSRRNSVNFRGLGNIDHLQFWKVRPKGMFSLLGEISGYRGGDQHYSFLYNNHGPTGWTVWTSIPDRGQILPYVLWNSGTQPTPYSLVWFGLFVHPFIHSCNTGHVNYRLQLIYYNTTYNIRTSTQYNTGRFIMNTGLQKFMIGKP
jgi:hypothetical protein